MHNNPGFMRDMLASLARRMRDTDIMVQKSPREAEEDQAKALEGSMTEANQPEATELLTRMAMSTNKSHQ